jgi:hypothetical protein
LTPVASQQAGHPLQSLTKVAICIVQTTSDGLGHAGSLICQTRVAFLPAEKGERFRSLSALLRLRFPAILIREKRSALTFLIFQEQDPCRYMHSPTVMSGGTVDSSASSHLELICAMPGMLIRNKFDGIECFRRNLEAFSLLTGYD